MSFSSRGLRLVNSLKKFSSSQKPYFDFINVFNKLQITALNDECLKGNLKVDLEMCNLAKVMHGGYISSLIDVTCVFAAIGRTNGRVGWTTNLNVNFINAVAEGEMVTIETKTLKFGKLPFMEATLYKENGKIVAKGTVNLVTGDVDKQNNFKEALKFDIFQD